MTPPIVKRYLIALDQHKWIGLAGFTIIVGASAVVGIQPAPTPVFKATGVLAYNGPIAPFSTTTQAIQKQGQELNEDTLLAENVIEAAATRVKADTDQIAKNAKVKLPEEDDPEVIQVSYTDSDPKRTSATLEALMQAMVEQSRLINSSRLRAIIDSISARLSPAEMQLREAQQRLEQYIRTEGPALVAAQDGRTLGAISGSQEQQRQIQMTLEGIDSQIRSLQNKLGLTASEAYTSSALSADPIINSLRSQIHQTETQLQILRRDLREEHPQIIQLKKQLTAYNELLSSRASEVMGGDGLAAPLPPSQIRRDSSLDPTRQGMANTLVALQTQRETLQQQLQASRKAEQQLRAEYVKIPNKQLDQARLQQQVQLKQGLYDKMQAALVDAKAAEAETVSSLTIAQPPQIAASEQKSQSLPLTVAVGALVGVLVGGGLIFLLAMLDGTFYTVEEVRAALRQRDVLVLGEVPFVVLRDPQLGETPILLQQDSVYHEYYERFRSNLRRASDQPLKVVLLTSTISQEGKTVNAYNLGIASAFAGKRTLVIETDLRSPSESKSLKVSPDPGASLEPLRYYTQLSECIRLVPDIENLYVVPSPGPVRNAAAILESSELRRLIEDARGRFDLVILDTPALSRCNDALLLEPYADGIVLVTRPGFTQESILVEAVDQLTEAELPLVGALINAVDTPVAVSSVNTEDIEADIEEEEEELEPSHSRSEQVPNEYIKR
jgi:capsular exopolysaccharide synthesis family protein